MFVIFRHVFINVMVKGSSVNDLSYTDEHLIYNMNEMYEYSYQCKEKDTTESSRDYIVI